MTQPESILGVVGLGTLGESVLHALAAAGRTVVGVDPDPDVLDRVARRLKAAGFDGEGVTLTDSLSAQAHADLIVEAVPEDLAVKTSVLRELHGLCAESTVLVTTTVTLPVAALAIAGGRPDRTVGLRLAVPATPGEAAEPVHTAMTSDAASAAVAALTDDVKLEVVSAGSRPGADADALVLALMNRAAAVLESGYADADDIDTAMRLGCGLPMGPLELVDRIGVGTVYSALTAERDRTGSASFEPAPVLRVLMTAGSFGRKSGQGFHTYNESGERLAAARKAGASTGSTATGTGAPVARIGVLGSGTMARGIAEVTASAGIPTVLVARGGPQAEQARAAVEASLTGRLRRGKVTPEAKTAALARLDTADDIAGLADCDLVVEAVVEDLDVKRELFARLGSVCKPGAVLATTTSSLSVAACARASGRAADVVGMHFFNPAPAMKLVELSRTTDTSDASVATARAVCDALGKTVVECPDRAGFIVNYLLFPYLNDAIRLLDRQGADIAETDVAVESGYGFPMGPFTLLDTIGLDVSLFIERRLYDEFGAPEFAPPALLEQLVADGAFGRKNRLGFRSARWNARAR